MASNWSGKVNSSKKAANGLEPILVQRFTHATTQEFVDVEQAVPPSVQNGAGLIAWAAEWRATIINMLDRRDAAIALIESKIGQ